MSISITKNVGEFVEVKIDGKLVEPDAIVIELDDNKATARCVVSNIETVHSIDCESLISVRCKDFSVLSCGGNVALNVIDTTGTMRTVTLSTACISFVNGNTHMTLTMMEAK